MKDRCECGFNHCEKCGGHPVDCRALKKEEWCETCSKIENPCLCIVKCSTGTSALFPEPQCEEPFHSYIFGDPYCKKCASKLIELHGDLAIQGLDTP